jgi:hypothetical protein
MRSHMSPNQNIKLQAGMRKKKEKQGWIPSFPILI